MELMDVYFIFTRHGAARPRCRCVKSLYHRQPQKDKFALRFNPAILGFTAVSLTRYFCDFKLGRLPPGQSGFLSFWFSLLKSSSPGLTPGSRGTLEMAGSSPRAAGPRI